MQSKPEIKIVPVFDQATNPKIWSEFARIEILCRTIEHGYKTTPNEANSIINRHKSNWEQNQGFAFAAYDNKEMVAFAKGYPTDEDDDEIYFSDLYVNPQYKGQGIGKQLLQQRERVASLFYDYVYLLALNEKVVPFFKKQGFTNIDNRYMYKNLTKIATGVIPVFKTLAGLRAKIKVNYDKEIIKQCKNRPVFVYVNDKQEIDGIIAETPNHEVKIWVNENKKFLTDFYKKQLLNAMNNVR